jgi:hypothetical protein
MVVTKRIVADKIAAYLQHGLTLDQLVDWAEHSLMDAEFEERDIDTLRTVIGRLGVADVRAFGLTWEDCEQALAQLGFGARVEIVAT